MKPGHALVAALALLASPADAQLVYKCMATDGNTFFSEGTCKGQGLKSVGKRGYLGKPPERSEILERWGLAESQLAELERKCGAGHANACENVATYREKTMAQVARDLTEEARKACRQGHKESCAALEANRREVARSIKACEAGDKARCDLLTRLAQ